MTRSRQGYMEYYQLPMKQVFPLPRDQQKATQIDISLLQKLPGRSQSQLRTKRFPDLNSKFSWLYTGCSIKAQPKGKALDSEFSQKQLREVKHRQIHQEFEVFSSTISILLSSAFLCHPLLLPSHHTLNKWI